MAFKLKPGYRETDTDTNFRADSPLNRMGFQTNSASPARQNGKDGYHAKPAHEGKKWKSAEKEADAKFKKRYEALNKIKDQSEYERKSRVLDNEYNEFVEKRSGHYESKPAERRSPSTRKLTAYEKRKIEDRKKLQEKRKAEYAARRKKVLAQKKAVQSKHAAKVKAAKDKKLGRNRWSH